MSEKKRVGVLFQEEIGTDIYRLVLDAKSIAKEALAGQFVMVYPDGESTLLPRPISICEADPETGRLTLVYRVVGKGTTEFSGLKAGMEIDIAGPLGNGFPLLSKKAILIGGGIGIPPMLELSKRLDCDKTVVLGYRDEIFLNEEFKPYADVVIASEDGKTGTKGTVIDAIKAQGVTGDVIYACGPMPMLRAIKAYADEHGIEAYISLEERMACGIGACLGCVVKTKEKDHHSHVDNARICKEGPVFDAKEVHI